MRLNKLQQTAVTALEDIKARDIKVLDVRKLTSFYDSLIIASAESNRQVKALAHHVRDKLKEAGANIVGVEGEETGEWVLVDAGDIVVHEDHGVGRFAGFETKTVANVTRDYLHLEYDGDEWRNNYDFVAVVASKNCKLLVAASSDGDDDSTTATQQQSTKKRTMQTLGKAIQMTRRAVGVLFMTGNLMFIIGGIKKRAPS